MQAEVFSGEDMLHREASGNRRRFYSRVWCVVSWLQGLRGGDQLPPYSAQTACLTTMLPSYQRSSPNVLVVGSGFK